MRCPNRQCMSSLAPHMRECPACGSDGGFPNVRLATNSDEVVQLELRFSKEQVGANQKGYAEEFSKLFELASEANAIICMPSTRLLDLISDSSLLSTFGLQLEGESRVAQDNRFDQIRSSVEEAYFPNFSKQIRFAALSLTDQGHSAYGQCSVSLKPSAISERASVFEMPLFEFAKSQSLNVGCKVPPGHRAPWAARGKLVCAKLGSHCAGLSSKEMAALLMPEPSDTLSDCVEVHIFGSINKFSIHKVVISNSTNRADELIALAVSEKLRDHGIELRKAA